MPVRTRKLKDGKVRVRTPGGVKAKATTPAKAVRQKRLLDAVEHGWKPTGKPASQSAAQKKARATIRKRMFN
jgi:hypothetical protein